MRGKKSDRVLLIILQENGKYQNRNKPLDKIKEG